MNAVNNFLSYSVPSANASTTNQEQSYRYLLNEPITDTVSFRSRGNNSEQKSKRKALGTILGSLLTAGSVFVGLGFLGKYNTQVVNKLTEKNWKKLADFVTKKDEGGVINFCQNGCSRVKGWGTSAWDWAKKLFDKKD